MTFGCRVAIVADDLTGALDAAAPFARRGATTRVVISLRHLHHVLAEWAAGGVDVIAVNTESRHLPVAQARACVIEAVETLQALKPQVLFKKIDSTLRGHVVAECLAARHACGRRLLVAPAVPAQGRTVRDGRVFIRGEPLEDSAFGHDARSAPPCGPLDALFAGHGLETSLLPAGGDPSRVAHDVIADAERDEDFDGLASQLLETPERWLAVGAAGLTSAMARAAFADPGPPVAPLFAQVLYTVGSRSPDARQQVAYLERTFPALPVVPAYGTGHARLPEAGSALLIPGAPATGSAEEVAMRMAERVAEMLESVTAGGCLLFLTGGDTAMAVMQRLGARYIDVKGEWSPGVPFGWLEGDAVRPVMTKAGGFGDEALLARLLRASTTRG